jgi:hypothetical protein
MEEYMRSLRALVMGAAIVTGVSALASAQPLPQNWSYGYRNGDRDRDHDRDRDRNRRVYGYYDNGFYNRRHYDRDDWRWKDRRRYRDRDDWRWRNHRDWDHDGDRR